MGLNISQFAKWLIDRARDMGVKLTIDSSALAKWAAENPAATAALLKAAGNIIHGVKATEFAGLMEAVAKARLDGASMKQILGGLGKGAWKGAGGAKALGIGAAKIAGLAIAAAFAKETVKSAAKAWNAQTSDIAEGWSEGNAGKVAKNIWELGWETSIPVATFRQLQSFGRWITGNGKKSKDAGVQGSGGAGRSGASAAREERKMQRQAQLQEQLTNVHPMAKQGYNVNTYERVAQKNNLVKAPANPQAYNEWRKKVEEVNNRNKPGNSTRGNTPDWYWKGKASKLLASTLTWSTIKNYYSTHENVSVASFAVDLMVPVEAGSATAQVKLHHEVTSNIEVLYEALRQKDTGAYIFAEGDVYWYLVSMASTIAKIRFLHKCIAIANTKSFEIQDLPKHMFAAIFGQTAWKKIYDDVVQHKADYAARLNDLAKEVNSKALLDCSLISRWNYLADKCFEDYSGPKAIKGTYIIKYAPANKADGSIEYVEFIKDATSSNTFATYIEKVENSWNYFNALLSTGTPATGLASRISASMIKLLGAKDKTFGNVPYITGTETIEYKYDPEVFDQLRNARFAPLRTNFNVLPAYAGTDAAAPYFTVTTGGTATTIDLGTYDDNDRLIATERNKEFLGKENIQMIQFSNLLYTAPIASGAVKMYLLECGTSLLDHMRIVTYSAGNAPTVKLVLGMLDQAQYLTFAGDSTQINFDADFLTKLSQIDYCPRIAVVRSDLGGTKNIGPVATYFDVDNFAFMTAQQYTDLNRVAVYSQFFFFNPEDLQVKGIVEA